MNLRNISLESIILSPYNTRTEVSPEEIEELAESIRRVGQIEAITVRPLGDRYKMVTGERRFLALKQAGFNEARCLVREMTDSEVMLTQWEENKNRKGYSDYAKALKLKQLQDANGWSQRELADELGKTAGYVNHLLNMLNLGMVFTMVNTLPTLYKMNERQARAILSAPEEHWQDITAFIKDSYETEDKIPTAREISIHAEGLQLRKALEQKYEHYEVKERFKPLEEPSPLDAELTEEPFKEPTQHFVEEIQPEDFEETQIPSLQEEPVFVEPEEVHEPPPKSVEQTIRNFYTQFPDGREQFIVGLLQSRHGLTYEEAKNALRQYNEGKTIAAPKPETAFCPFCGAKITTEKLHQINIKIEPLKPS